MILTVDPAHPGKKFALGTIGLSLEAQELVTPDLSASHESLVALMRRLGPGVLRLGGSSLDSSWWTSRGEQPPAWATSVVTPSDLVGLRGLLKATNWRVILGVDLGHYDPARAANEASFAERMLGSSLLGFEIGNEPNDYPGLINKLRGGLFDQLRPSSYGVYNYLEEITKYSAAMRAAAPKIRLYGPDLGSRSLQAWLPAILSDTKISFAEITQHYYPTSYNDSKGICEVVSVPTALELLSPQVRERENDVLRSLVEAGHVAYRQTRISETNTTASCTASGGPDTSPVFASALWSLDWVLRTASAGVAGLNFHGYFGRCGPNTLSPICAPGHAAEARGEVVAHPEYYGLLAARELEGGRFVPVGITGQTVLGDFTAYATVHSRGVITLAIDNFSNEGLASFLLKAPGYDKATSESLVAPSVSATDGVTFGHASINAAGVLRPTSTTIPRLDGAFQLKLAPTTAIVITLHK